MPSLVIVESPGKIKKISAILGPGYVVKASVGHVRDLPRKALGVDLSNFMPEYEATERGADVLRGLKAAVSTADTVYIATDPDREGESIAWHLCDALKLKSPKRISFNEITPHAVKSALASPRNLDMPLVRAADARRVLDRLIGWLVSPVLSDSAGKQLSAGRVQSPAVRLVVERERAIRDFRPTSHFGVDLHFDGGEGGGRWKASWDARSFLKPGDEYILDHALASLVAAVREVAVSGYEESETRAAPKPPFTTSALQQAASASLKLKPKQTMDAAQKLYEQGHITYMRTDSPNLSDDGYADAVAAARGSGWPVAATRRVFKAKDDAQQGHEAIRPTHCAMTEAGETDAERALYRLIRSHTLASVLDDAVYSVRSANLCGSEPGGAPVKFSARGKTLVAPGWKAVYQEADEAEGEAADDGSDNPVPKLTGRGALTAAGGSVVAKTTKAPGRYKQATLVKELENRGIGRPSTYAAILENILGREYVSEDAKDFLHAEPPGEKVVDGLAGKASFINYQYTRTLESQLDDIAAGKSEYLSIISAAHKILSGELSAVGAAAGPSHACPKCSQPMRRRAGKEAGVFWWGCSGYPACKNTMADVEGKPVEKEARPADDAGARVYYVVDFEKREAAKKAGLRWDGERKKWYAPDAEVAAGCRGFKKAG